MTTYWCNYCGDVEKAFRPAKTGGLCPTCFKMDQAAPRCEPSIADTMDKIISLLQPFLQTKFSKLLWARANATPIGMVHDDSWKRISMAYADFERLYQTYSETFLTHTNHPGIIVIAPQTIIDSDKAVDKWLMSRLGSDEDISCVIGIEGPGTVAAKEQVDAFLTIAKDRGLVELTKDKGKAPTGNKIWHGHYFVKLSGNGVNTFEVGCVPLANDAIEYINKADAADVKAQVLYMMLCARNAERLLADPAKFPEAKETLRAICEARGLLDWSKFPVAPMTADGVLRCWSEHEMSADNFLCDQYSQSYAQKCHVDSVANARLDFDPEAKKLKTCARPYAFMWGIMRFNMLQGRGSIDDARHDLHLDELADLRRRLAKYEAV